ncbi:MAG: PilZ domain-containing protein [Deltaproteobacteria bacterium]|nr:PilZ domain-containing protein [Deltaproteobacteria bacterium]
MKKNTEKREFERYPTKLMMKVTAADSEGSDYEEEAVLENISGSGAKFSSQSIERYFLGQSLELVVDLPGTSDVKACMRVKATVVRIDSPTDSGFFRDSGEGAIAVQFDSSFDFERIN